MTNDDFVAKTIKKQESVRVDIRALKTGIDQLCVVTTANSDLLHQVLRFQKAQDERDSLQAEIAQDVARIAHSVTKLVESMHAQNQELTGLIRELRMSTAVDRSLESLIVKINSLGEALDA